MKPIAIHHLSYGFTQRWIEYCEKNSIPYKKVNCYDYDIIEQLKNCSALLWHWDYSNYRDRQFAPALILSAEKMGLKTLPNYNSCWHFDNKVHQKYLLESLNIPFAQTWVFYDKTTAKKWLSNAVFPIVFKLKTGAGGQNVKLLKDANTAKKHIRQAFSAGFKPISNRNLIKDKFDYFLRTKATTDLIKFLKRIYHSAFSTYNAKFIENEKGYIYFQKYMPNNEHDTRLVVIGDRCFGLRRYNRKNDFRASGSGLLGYEKQFFNLEAIEIAFNASSKLKTNVITFDFLNDYDDKPVIVEISYGFSIKAYDQCVGYWDRSLNWHAGEKIFQDIMIEDIIKDLSKDD